VKVAVTGGSGVVGTSLIKHLIEAGHDVRALARSTRSVGRLASLGATPVRGDVLDYYSLGKLVDGVEWVFHVAGVNELCTKDPDHMWRVNVEGTRLVMNACRSSGVSRMIHTSSAVTFGEGDGLVATERTPHRGRFLSDYEHSKTAAERLLFSEARGLDVVAVNPSSVQGPGRSTGTGRILLGAARGNLPFVIDTTLSLIDIDDCARGHLLAADKGAAGARYLLSGATVTMSEALALLSVATGRDLSPRFINPWLAYGLGSVVGVLYRLLGRTPPICGEAVRVMSRGHRYDGSRATRELGLEYTPIDDTLRRTVEWFESEGLL
jgi:dihydroflavonol-4-reductase